MPPTEHASGHSPPPVDARLLSTQLDMPVNETFGRQVREVVAALRDLLTSSQSDPDRLFTAEELAELFQLSPRTLKDHAAARAITHHRFGKHYRFSRIANAEILRG